MTRFKYLLALGVTVVATAGASSPAPDPRVPVALATLQPGQWALRSRDGSAPPKTLCLGDPRALLQVRHGAALCTRTVLTNNASEVIVNYSCAGGGNGRTEIRVETPRVIQIESQGIADKAPFEWTYEGRRVGECAIPGAMAQR